MGTVIMRILTALGLALFMVMFALGVPLLGWGISDWQAYFDSPVRLLYSLSVILTALVSGIGYLLLPFPYTLGKREGNTTKRISRQSIVPIIARLIWFSIFILSPFSDRHDFAVIINADWLGYVGVLLYLLGFAWVVWSFLTLGKQHSGEVTIQKEHELITNWPYRWIRNPMYLGLVVFPFGIALVFGSWIGIALPILLIGLFIWRIRDEEKLLKQEFGQRWENYCKHTWRLIPYIY